MHIYQRFIINIQCTSTTSTLSAYSYIADAFLIPILLSRIPSFSFAASPQLKGILPRASRYTARYALQLHDGASRNTSSDAIKRVKGVTADTSGRPSRAPRSTSRKIVSLSLASDCPPTFSFPGARIWLCRKMKKKKVRVGPNSPPAQPLSHPRRLAPFRQFPRAMQQRAICH